MVTHQDIVSSDADLTFPPLLHKIPRAIPDLHLYAGHAVPDGPYHMTIDVVVGHCRSGFGQTVALVDGESRPLFPLLDRSRPPCSPPRKRSTGLDPVVPSAVPGLTNRVDRRHGKKLRHPTGFRGA